MTYATPDSTWDTFQSLRVLTGRDFDVEGLAVKNHTYAIVGDELMPALFPIDVSTGIVLGPMVRTPSLSLCRTQRRAMLPPQARRTCRGTSPSSRTRRQCHALPCPSPPRLIRPLLRSQIRTPDIDENGEFNGKFLSSGGDKVHCTIEALQANECMSVTNDVVDASEYVRHGSSGGFEGLAMMADGSVTAFIERNTGSVLADRGEPGIRVFRVLSDPLMFESFLGFYPFELGACCIADISPVPGSSTKILVAERADWPNGKNYPGQGQPNNRVCMIDTSIRNADMTFKKSCILNYQHVSDPYDVDGNGLTTAAFSQWTTEQLIVLDDFCMIAGAPAASPPPRLRHAPRNACCTRARERTSPAPCAAVQPSTEMTDSHTIPRPAASQVRTPTSRA